MENHLIQIFEIESAQSSLVYTFLYATYFFQLKNQGCPTYGWMFPFAKTDKCYMWMGGGVSCILMYTAATSTLPSGNGLKMLGSGCVVACLPLHFSCLLNLENWWRVTGNMRWCCQVLLFNLKLLNTLVWEGIERERLQSFLSHVCSLGGASSISMPSYCFCWSQTGKGDRVLFLVGSPVWKQHHWVGAHRRLCRNVIYVLLILSSPYGENSLE